MLFETDIPIPAATRYPFAQLTPGQSVLFPCADAPNRRKARKAAYRLAEYHGWKVTVRSLPDGVRVWRHN